MIGGFGMDGTTFLVFYLGLMLLAVFAGVVIPFVMRPAGRTGAVPDADMLAMLTGGPAQLLDTAVARVMAADRLVYVDKVFSVARTDTAADRFEQRLRGLAPPISWSAIRQLQPDLAAPVEQRLVAANLWMDAADAKRMRWMQTLPYLMLLALGAVRMIYGELHDRPIAYLGLLMFFTAFFAVMRAISLNRITRVGKQVLVDAKRMHERLQKAPTRAEVPLGVALFGTSVLAATPWQAFHTMRTSSSNDGGGGGSTSESGSGCGSGCGGCGGD
jgi:uncharacterized protein (TIGR04222 family)